ncbi:ABC transporter permease DevC [Maridesulfovibrio sp. FT414]|uniref:ABC transporter permease DevC n=1 Tax=Maridesulfovibrio sp. FT414 TaxID=2979469 RepID=UPI003D8064ED
MGMRKRIPLAWKQLVNQPRRLIAAIAGITFAVVLVLVQLGFKDALMRSATAVHRHLDTDLVMFSRSLEYLGADHPFASVRLYQCLADREVAEVEPFYVHLGKFRNLENGYSRSLLIMGVMPGTLSLQIPGVMDNTDKLKVTGDILYDRFGMNLYGPVVETFEKEGPFKVVTMDRRTRLVGLFGLGTSFIAYGNVVTGIPTYLQLFPHNPKGLVNFGLIRLAKGTDPHAVKVRLNKLLDADDVIVVTKDEFIQKELDYWANTAAVGFVFEIGAVMGLIVGMVIVYQILYTDVNDHLSEYATLKAMGYPNGFFSRLVLKESLILSMLGYPPGALISWAIYAYTSSVTGWAMILTPGKVAFTYSLTLGMCVISGCLAMRRVQHADPAEIF